MSHRSRLAGFITDCQHADTDVAARSRGRALGPQPQESDDNCAQHTPFDGAKRGLHIEVRRVSHATVVHLDIEADDVDAEADRLEALGARGVGFVRRWWVCRRRPGLSFAWCPCTTPSVDRRRTSGPDRADSAR